MRIAIIGSGIAGLGAAYLLNKDHQVTVYERNSYAGGHSNTVDVPIRTRQGETKMPVDTGFIVFNERTYPNLLGLFDHLSVPVKKTDMSFAVSIDKGRIEYGGSSLATLFAQPRNLFSPRFHRMLRDLLRFYRHAPELLDHPNADRISLGDYLDFGGYGDAFARDHLLPMGAAIWSCSTESMRDFPVNSFIRFFVNHGLLELKERPQWWTVDGGSREYVKRIRNQLSDDVHIGRPARSVRRVSGGVAVRDDDGIEQLYDQAVLACHGDEAFRLLEDKNDLEGEILGSFRYQKNEAVLHMDRAQMPKRRLAWSSWNYLADSKSDGHRQVAVTYWMNRLQHLNAAHPVFVTLNPIETIPAEKIVDQFVYDHPMFDAGAVAAQKKLPAIQGSGGVWFCGSYCGYGFHEDGLASAVAVARRIGADIPWGHRPHQAMEAVDGGARQRPAVAA
ncbi:NAD(P)/FAD-dependent oxidoreductase [Hwanghaeella sp.]|uniref:NAD(P)/FAD-dependent oxidoreductase n=1 Tax=Hwanghaeella sp. TaxID=2605943 RepID=UPI003CCBC695